MTTQNKPLSPLSIKLAALKAGQQTAKPAATGKLAEIIARAKARNIQAESTKTAAIQAITSKLSVPAANTLPTPWQKVEYNEDQQAFINLGKSGQSCVLIGAAGTGKTTSLKGLIAALLQHREVESITDMSHKHLLAGIPGILCTSYTRRAVSNMKKSIPDMAENSITIHKAIEFSPEFYHVLDPVTQEMKQTMRFLPTRHKARKLDSAIQIVVIDEAGTVPMDLYNMLLDALVMPENIQFIYLGDLNQLPPVFGASVLGIKGLELKHNVIELKQVYRQALESPIIRLAHRILSGLPLPASEFPKWCDDKLTIRPWKRRISSDIGLETAAVFFKHAYEQGNYDPATDMILIPQNVKFGTDELNKKIANMQAKVLGREVHEIIAGWQKLYYAVGDSVLYEKEDCIIESISINGVYQGIQPQQASTNLDYWGHNKNRLKAYQQSNTSFDLDTHIDASIASAGAEFDRTKAASHTITLRRKTIEQGEEMNGEIVLDTASELMQLSLAYCLTVHKSQGSEWKRVFLVFHHSHSQMIFRELLYTAVTRARDQLYILCEPDTFTKGITSQRIKGHTIEDKLAYFADKLANNKKAVDTQ